MPSDNSQARDLRPLSVLAIHAVVFAALLWWSWRKWPDPLVDFGRELYVPWRINAGQVLYRDLASLFGPLSPYVNALWFRMFGVSLLTLALCNLVIFSATVAGIHHLVRLSTDRVTATVASLTTVVLFGFSQYIDVGNYNFITPYSHEATHGIALSVACLVSLHHGLASRSRKWCAVAGVCLGLAFLTKPEIAMALAVGVLAGWVTAYAMGGLDRTELSVSVPLFVTMALLPPLLFYAYFVTQMDSAAALHATAGAWVPLFGTGITSNAFYRWSMGLDAPMANAGRMLATFGVFIALMTGVIAVSWVSTEASPSLGKRALRIGLLAVAIVLLRDAAFPRALPMIAVTALVAVCVLFARDRSHGARATRLRALIMWIAFAVVLLAKIGLNARVVHYGFYLAPPAVVAGVVFLCWVIPHVLARWKSETVARTARWLGPWIVAAAVAPYLAIAHGWYRIRTLPVGSGADLLFASTRGGQGRIARGALAMLDAEAHPGATLAVLPEGVMLNYLMRLESPLRVINLMPPELLAFGEEDVLRSLAARPPDFVLLLRRNTSEYGYPLFGSDPRYGLRTMSWINERYENVRGTSQAEGEQSSSGIRLLRRKD